MTDTTTLQPIPESGCPSHDLLAVARWLTGDDTGVSSKFIAAVWIAGQVIPSRWGDSTPSDAPDLGRCVRLLELAPSIRNVFPVLREASPVWAAYVDHWDELTALNNSTTGADWYPVVTGRMRDLRSSANADVDLPDTAAQDSASKPNSPAVSG